MAAEFYQQADALVVKPGKRLDTTTSPEVDREITTRIEAGESKIVFDFDGTDYVSSAGLRVMMKAAKATAKLGGGVGLCHANAHVREVLDLCGFLSLFKAGKTIDKTIQML
ncbi:STAS domain-containing protein [Lamprobacter modestohalophilus]|uniref:STAS domain-containing protein n=1 Tax=Lamprobacter modestohalophilus TaxID=1064514 RepID=UPI002ADEDA9E|nr:STAS domain-containing protein [Lamprobacter modestohalophilus]MEA1049217.1 STAS domain-containing protein [Lamprobacter modestohalophilus]